jgi:Zn-dependent protease
MPDGRSVTSIVLTLIVILGSVALHEFAHAKSADSYGDDTPRLMGRVTLNPLAHLDPLGTIMIIFTVISGFGIGWGKPVQVDPRKMENPRWDHMFSVLWGPLTNVIIAVVAAFLYRGALALGLDIPMWAHDVAFFAVMINLGLAAFNMLPIGPLDGHWILGILMPPEVGHRFIRWSQTQGSLILLGIIFMGPLIGFSPLSAYYRGVVIPVAAYLLGI